MMLPKPVMSAMHEREGNAVFRVGSSCVNGFRENMEDAHLVHLTPQWGFFGVFDGHVNDHCSAYLAKEFETVLADLKPPITDERMKEIALGVDKKYLALRQTGAELGGSTGTFCLALVKGGKIDLQVGNVGDSRVLVCEKGQCREMTKDHKPTNEDEYERIMRCNGYVEGGRVNGSLALSRAFGDPDYKSNDADQLANQVIALPDVTHIELPYPSPGDFALLACDGVFEGEFSNEQVIEYAKEQLSMSNDLAEVSFKVCEEAIRRGSKDNISCMIVQFCPGSDYERLTAKAEFVPGPLNATGHSGFMKAYWNMCTKGHITPTQALEKRYDALKQLPETEETLAEMQLFRGGPPAELTGAARTEWFDQVEESLRGTTAPQPTDPRAALLNHLQQRGVSLASILNAMREDNQDVDDEN